MTEREQDAPAARHMRRRVGQVNHASLAEVLTRLAQTTGGVPADQITVTMVHLTWQSPETDEEMAARIEHERAAAERQRAWERGQWERLKVRAVEEGWDQ